LHHLEYVASSQSITSAMASPRSNSNTTAKGAATAAMSIPTGGISPSAFGLHGYMVLPSGENPVSSAGYRLCAFMSKFFHVIYAKLAEPLSPAYFHNALFRHSRHSRPTRLAPRILRMSHRLLGGWKSRRCPLWLPHRQEQHHIRQTSSHPPDHLQPLLNPLPTRQPPKHRRGIPQCPRRRERRHIRRPRSNRRAPRLRRPRPHRTRRRPIRTRRPRSRRRRCQLRTRPPPRRWEVVPCGQGPWACRWTPSAGAAGPTRRRHRRGSRYRPQQRGGGIDSRGTSPGAALSLRCGRAGSRPSPVAGWPSARVYNE
jgi:hypothetical protein